jgi:hydrogenase-4 component B
MGLLLAGLASVAVLLGRSIGGPLVVRRAPPWVCGVALEPGMQYSAAALAKPIRIIFRVLLRPYRAVEREHAASPHFVSGIRFEAGLSPLYDRPLYRHAVRLCLGAAREVRILQNGSLRSYLAYMLVTLVAALLLARPGGWP